MSFIQRAREAAEAAAAKAGEAASSADPDRPGPGDPGEAVGPGEAGDGRRAPGISTVVERIDPGVLADLIVKATALQEMTNGSLREKHSPYRISEVASRPRSRPGSRSRSAVSTTSTRP